MAGKCGRLRANLLVPIHPLSLFEGLVGVSI